MLAGLYGGIKFFIIDFLFKSCPKLRDKYDTPYIVWHSLPTDPQLKERSNATVSRRVRTLKHTPHEKQTADEALSRFDHQISPFSLAVSLAFQTPKGTFGLNGLKISLTFG